MRTDAIPVRHMARQPAAAGEVLQLWFGSATDDAQVAADQAALWWAHGPETDAELESRFGALARHL